MTVNVTRVGGTKPPTINCAHPTVQEHLRITDGLVFPKEFFLTSARILALNAAPITVLAAPGAGLALVFEGATLQKPAGTAYAGIAAGEDLAFRYTNGSGDIVAQCETTGFLDQTTNQIRYVRPFAGAGTPAAPAASDITPVANAALVIHMTAGEITTGDSPLIMRIFYRVVKTDLSYMTNITAFTTP